MPVFLFYMAERLLSEGWWVVGLQALIVFGLIRTQYNYEYAAVIIILLCGIYVVFMKKFSGCTIVQINK
jgi:hypothetical protein